MPAGPFMLFVLFMLILFRLLESLPTIGAQPSRAGVGYLGVRVELSRRSTSPSCRISEP